MAFFMENYPVSEGYCCSVTKSLSYSLQPQGLQHPRLPCPSLFPGVCSNYVHCVSETIQPSHSMLLSSPPALSLSQHQGCDPSQIRCIRSQERNPVVPASTCHEALFHCTKPSGVPRGPSQLHSIPDFSEAPRETP